MFAGITDREMTMPLRFAVPLALSLGLVAGCATPQQQVESKEDMLAASGFVARPANTPERQTMLRTLPPERFVRRARGNSFVYVFADPLVCACLYVGDQAAYGRYRQLVLQRRIADDQLLAAQLNEQAAWDWGPWGPYPYW